ncbi:MAG: hypothetical protein EOO13_16480 [Chitinophagaceae bacterium]|nr:MAG: hypothetical protein EOO13_16480 [Chitinophagaceae bacterium]
MQKNFLEMHLQILFDHLLTFNTDSILSRKNTKRFDMNDLSLDSERYNTILSDILQGKNLHAHLQEIEAAIKDVEKFIALALLRQEDAQEYAALKNQLYYLKYEILERL